MSPETSFAAYVVLIVLVVAQRLSELRLSARNARSARAAGAVEVGSGHYPWMVGLHTSFLVACPLEAWLLDRPLIPSLAATMLFVLLAATILRYAAIGTLAERWTTRVYRWPPGRELVTTGPYRWMRHPNYLAVQLEILALPLIHGAWITAVAFSFLNIWLLRVRIAIEEEALAASGGDSSTPPLPGNQS